MKTQLIAEIGANHGGNIDLAIKMIEAAAASGASWVKFQSWRAETLPQDAANRAWYEQAQLSDDDHLRLIEACNANGVRFLTTCFDRGRIAFLASLGLDTIKVASPDLASQSMLRELRECFPHMIVSTGMSFDEEIARTAQLLENTSFTFLHCVSIYPTPLESVNMSRMNWLRQFTPSVGYSDHTLGVDAGKLAIAQGAVFIEKHFTISRYLPGKDQAISCEPHEFRQLADYANLVEQMMGTSNPGLSQKEQELRGIYIGKWGNNR